MPAGEAMLHDLKFNLARALYWLSHRCRGGADWLLLSCMSPAVRAVMKELVAASRIAPAAVEATPEVKPPGELN